MEKLIRIALAEHGLREEIWNTGKDCGLSHREWFELSPDKILATIERWARWMDSEPYNADGTLDDR